MDDVDINRLILEDILEEAGASVVLAEDGQQAIDRLMEAGFEREDIVQRLMCQMPISEKISRSDFTVDNNGAPQEMLPRIKQISRALQAQAQEQA